MSVAKVKLSRATGAGEWPSHAVLLPLPGLSEARRGARRGG